MYFIFVYFVYVFMCIYVYDDTDISSKSEILIWEQCRIYKYLISRPILMNGVEIDSSLIEIIFLKHGCVGGSYPCPSSTHLKSALLEYWTRVTYFKILTKFLKNFSETVYCDLYIFYASLHEIEKQISPCI